MLVPIIFENFSNYIKNIVQYIHKNRSEDRKYHFLTMVSIYLFSFRNKIDYVLIDPSIPSNTFFYKLSHSKLKLD